MLKLIIPQSYGGIEESWITVMQINLKFTEVDSSLAHLFSYQARVRYRDQDVFRPDLVSMLSW